MFNEQGTREFLSNADEQVLKMMDISHYDKYEDPTTVEICSEICYIVKKRLKQECDAYVVGPRAMGLSEGKPDYIIFLDIGQDRFYSDRNYKENVQLLKKFENIFRNEAKWRVLRLQYPLPALSVVYLPTKNRCDLNVTNGFSVQISAMIGHFFEIQPEAIKFYHFINRWLRINNINFKDFILTLLVMNYLQENNYMPSAFRAQKNIPQCFIEGIPVSFDSNRDISSYGVKKMTYYYSHIRGFFRYYSNFNFAENVISTFYGYPVQKDEYEPKLDYDSPMCIAAFLNQKCNTSRKITDEQVYNFMSVCSASYKYLIENNF